MRSPRTVGARWAPASGPKKSAPTTSRKNRVTDHRIGFTTHRLAEMLNGDLTEIGEALTTHYRAEMLKYEEPVVRS